jgi:hypothetical protein
MDSVQRKLENFKKKEENFYQKTVMNIKSMVDYIVEGKHQEENDGK